MNSDEMKKTETTSDLDDTISPETPQASTEFVAAPAPQPISKPIQPLSSSKQPINTPSADGKPDPDPRQHRRAKPLAAALIGIVVLALGFGGGWLGAIARGNDATNITQQKTVLTSQAAVVSNIAKTVGTSVVSVNVTSQSATTSNNPYAALFGGGSGSQTEESAGTGMIINADGLIMTNRHVVPSGTTKVSVTLSDGTEYDNVQVVGRTNDNDSLDVAFLKITDLKGKMLTPVKLGNSSKVAVGDPVVAIGNALGQFQNTVTSGIISGYGRSVQASDSSGTSSENLDDLFQTDAAINEGNSGGPLVNLDGEVIGMNTAIASDSQNIGFAIPIDDLSGLVSTVESTGKLQRPYLGVVFVSLTADIAKQYELDATSGAYIPKASDLGSASLVSGGPAEDAGLKEGDIISKVDGTSITQTVSLTSLLDKHKPGDKVSLTIIRGNDTITKDVTLGTAPSS